MYCKLARKYTLLSYFLTVNWWARFTGKSNRSPVNCKCISRKIFFSIKQWWSVINSYCDYNHFCHSAECKQHMVICSPPVSIVLRNIMILSCKPFIVNHGMILLFIYIYIIRAQMILLVPWYIVICSSNSYAYPIFKQLITT